MFQKNPLSILFSSVSAIFNSLYATVNDYMSKMPECQNACLRLYTLSDTMETLSDADESPFLHPSLKNPLQPRQSCSSFQPQEGAPT